MGRKRMWRVGGNRDSLQGNTRDLCPSYTYTWCERTVKMLQLLLGRVFDLELILYHVAARKNSLMSGASWVIALASHPSPYITRPPQYAVNHRGWYFYGVEKCNCSITGSTPYITPHFSAGPFRLLRVAMLCRNVQGCRMTIFVLYIKRVRLVWRLGNFSFLVKTND